VDQVLWLLAIFCSTFLRASEALACTHAARTTEPRVLKFQQLLDEVWFAIKHQSTQLMGIVRSGAACTAADEERSNGVI
jgi:hypothetical protein